MKTTFKFYRTVSAFLLSLLGFASCSKTAQNKNEEELPAPMYGMPYSSLVVKAAASTESGKAIPGIKVCFTSYIHDQDGTRYVSSRGELVTGSDGTVQHAFTGDFSPSSVDVVFEDVDGEANGGDFQTLSIEGLEVTRTAEGSGWNEGDFEVSAVAKMTLK